MAIVYPKRSESVCKFFESIGIDPYTVLEEGLNEYGFRQKWNGVRPETPEQRILVGNEFPIQVVAWPNGIEDWKAFDAAHEEDTLRVAEISKPCIVCGLYDDNPL